MRPGGWSSPRDCNSDFRALPIYPPVVQLLLSQNSSPEACPCPSPKDPLPGSLLPNLPVLASPPLPPLCVFWLDHPPPGLEWPPFPLCLPPGHPSSQTFPPDLPFPPLHSAVCLSSVTQVLKPPFSFPATNSLLTCLHFTLLCL